MLQLSGTTVGTADGVGLSAEHDVRMATPSSAMK
jgi:hypothetical protein